MVQWWRRLVSTELARLRRDGPAALRWSMRITLAAVASYVVGVAAFPGTKPLLAPLTAMLVVQVTPVSLLASGVDRVISVVAGVALATVFAAAVPLAWWSLGILIFVSLTLGQFLRLRDNLLEVAISAMLVLGVATIGREAAAWQRITETLVGAAVGIFGNLLFPPKVPSGDAGRAIDGLADKLKELLNRAAGELETMAESGSDPDSEPGERSGDLRTASRIWLDDARRITHDIPQVGAALLRAEESRKLNVRAVRTPHVEPGLRQGMEALEHSAVAIRGLMRGVADASDGEWLERDDAVEVLGEVAQTLRQMAAGIDAFGELVRNEADVHLELSASDIHRLRDALEGLHAARARLDAYISAESDPDVLELHTLERSTVRRLLRELDLEERVRRELRLLRPRKRVVPRPPPLRRPRTDLQPPPGPDADTQVIPQVTDDPPPSPPRPRSRPARPPEEP